MPAPHAPRQPESSGSGVLYLAVVRYDVQPPVEEDLVLPATAEDGVFETIICNDGVLAAAAPHGVLARVITLFRCVNEVVPATAPEIVGAPEAGQSVIAAVAYELVVAVGSGVIPLGSGSSPYISSSP